MSDRHHSPRFLTTALAALLFSALSLAGASHASTTVTVRPDATGSSNADAFVATGPTNNLTGNNYGAGGAVAVTAALAKGAFDSLIRIDVSNATSIFDTAYGTGGWAIDSIVLELTSTTPNNAIFNSPNTAGMFGVSWFGNDVWTEGTGSPNTPTTNGVVWNDVAALVSGAQSLGTFSYDAAGTDQYALALSGGLTADVLSGGQVGLYLTAADSAVSALFGSRNNGTTANRPALIITASPVPEPGRAALAIIGALALVMRRRRV